MKRILIILILILSWSVAGAANIYIDPTCGTPGDGSDYTCDGNGTDPHDSWDDVSISSNNNYYQRARTTWNGNNSGLTEIPLGTADSVTIGSYTHGVGPDAEGADITRPIIDNNTSNDKIFYINGSNNTIMNLHLKDGEQVVYFRPTEANESGNKISYCTIAGSTQEIVGSAIRAQSTGSYTQTDLIIEYNDVDLAATTDEPGDAISLGRYTIDPVVRYNTINNFEHAGIFSNADGALILSNYIEDDNDRGDNCLDFNPYAVDNIARYNYCNGAEWIQIEGAARIILDKNIIDCATGCDGFSDYSAIQVAVHALGTGDLAAIVNGNVVYNYDADMYCIEVVTFSGDAYGADGSKFTNNICHTGGGANREPFKLQDDNETDDSTLVWENNNAYNWSGTNYADMDGVFYATATLFNAYAYAQNNVDEDPQLNDVASGEFWPASSSSNSLDSGYNAGYDDYLRLDSSWTPHPPDISTLEDLTDNKGAYTWVPLGTIKGMEIQ